MYALFRPPMSTDDEPRRSLRDFTRRSFLVPSYCENGHEIADFSVGKEPFR